MAPRVVVIGSGPEVRGGVSAVAQVWARSGLYERWHAEYLPTHCDGTAARKLALAARAWCAFVRRLASGEVALLHAHVNSDASFWRKALFVLAARAARVPYVLHVHCGGFGEFHRDRCGPLARAFVRHVFRHAAAVIALSEVAAAELRAIAAARPVEVIPNPVEIPPARDPSSARDARVAFLGMLTQAKGVFDLLRAWPKVAAAVPGARLVLAGSGDLAAIRQNARVLGIEGSVELPGWIGSEDKRALLAGAAVFVLPSHREAMPMALLEAMAAGLPVVATPVGAVGDMLADGRGELVPVGDERELARALAALLRDGPRREALGRAARDHVMERFSAEVVVPRVEALWEGVLRGASDVSGPTRRAGSQPLRRMDYAQRGPGITAGQVAPPS